MIKWVTDRFTSPSADLVLTAIASGILVGASILTVQHAGRRTKIADLKRSIPALEDEDKHNVATINSFGGASYLAPQDKEDARSAALAARARAGDYDEDLILEQLARNRIFLTDAGLANLRNAFIIVVGCGGVGSHAAAALARSGAGKLRLIDFDQVTLSSLNRHAVATLADVGTPKVNTMSKRLEQITPWTTFDCRNQLFNASVAATQLAPWTTTGQKPDYVIDAIDNIESKVDLLHYCATNNIKCISSMGAGCKSDPTKIFVGDISASTEDPLSRSTRRRLRLKGIASGIPCVYSQEKPGAGKAELQPVNELEVLKGSVNELGVLPDFRVRILPVLGSMPAIFGLTVANHVVLDIADYPREYGAIKARDKMYEAALSSLQGLEERLARYMAASPELTGVRIPVSQDDAGYLIEEVFRGKSVVSGLGNRLALVRWEKPRPDYLDRSLEGQITPDLGLEELVCMTKDEAMRHEKLVLKGDTPVQELYSPSVLEAVEKRRAEERVFSVYR